MNYTPLSVCVHVCVGQLRIDLNNIEQMKKNIFFWYEMYVCIRYREFLKWNYGIIYEIIVTHVCQIKWKSCVVKCVHTAVLKTIYKKYTRIRLLGIVCDSAEIRLLSVQYKQMTYSISVYIHSVNSSCWNFHPSLLSNLCIQTKVSNEIFIVEAHIIANVTFWFRYDGKSIYAMCKTSLSLPPHQMNFRMFAHWELNILRTKKRFFCWNISLMRIRH